jgi:hypothetical protein
MLGYAFVRTDVFALGPLGVAAASELSRSRAGMNPQAAGGIHFPRGGRCLRAASVLVGAPDRALMRNGLGNGPGSRQDLASAFIESFTAEDASTTQVVAMWVGDGRATEELQ